MTFSTQNLLNFIHILATLEMDIFRPIMRGTSWYPKIYFWTSIPLVDTASVLPHKLWFPKSIVRLVWTRNRIKSPLQLTFSTIVRFTLKVLSITNLILWRGISEPWCFAILLTNNSFCGQTRENFVNVSARRLSTHPMAQSCRDN